MDLMTVDHELITGPLDRAFFTLRGQRPPRHAQSFHPSSYFECGFKQVADRLGYAWTNDPQRPDWEFGGTLGDGGHDRLQRRLASAPELVYLVPSFNEKKEVRDKERAESKLQPAIEYPFEDYTMSAAKYLEAKKLGIGRARRDGMVQGSKRNKRGNPSASILEIKMWKHSDFWPEDERAKGYQNSKLADHEAQVQLYMYLSEDNDGEQVENSLIYIVNRERPEQRRLERAKLRWSFIQPELLRLENMQALFMQGKLPEPEPARGSCSMCNYHDLCPLPAKQKKGKRPPTVEQVYGTTALPLITRSRPGPGPGPVVAPEPVEELAAPAPAPAPAPAAAV